MNREETPGAFEVILLLETSNGGGLWVSFMIYPTLNSLPHKDTQHTDTQDTDTVTNPKTDESSNYLIPRSQDIFV